MLKSIHTKPSFTSVFQSKVAFKSNKSDEKREIILRTRSNQKQLYGQIIRSKPNGKISTSTDSNESFSSAQGVDCDAPNEMKVLSSNQASEFYWLVRKEHISSSKANNIKVLRFGKESTSDVPSKKDSGTETVSTSSTSYKSQDTTEHSSSSPSNWSRVLTNTDRTSQTPISSAKNAIISAKNLIQELVSKKEINNKSKQCEQQIPFNKNSLSSILSYPLFCEKNEMNQTMDLLANRSLRLPSISKVLQATMPESSRIALKKWKLSKIAELGFYGFKKYEKETFDRGKQFHSAIEDFLRQGTIPDRDSAITKLWDSIDGSLKELQPKPVLLEQPILHTDLKYHGIIDNVSMVDNELCAFEWKTSEKLKPRLTSTYDAPVQLCAYLGALNSDPRYDLTVKNGRVVVAYKNGDTANVFNLTYADLRKYWLVWLQRLQEYWIRVRDGTLPDPI